MKIFALDIGGSKIISAIGTIEDRQDHNRRKCTLEIIARKVLPPDTTQDKLFEAIRDVFPGKDRLRECDAVGVNIPGLADPDTGMWVYAPFSGIKNIPVVKLLSEMLSEVLCPPGVTPQPLPQPLPIGIENDVNACALAEKLFGNCAGINDFLWITVSNGIGGGLVLGGDVFRGAAGNAGEIGHFVLVENGAKCGCGNLGCLEAEAAGPAIARRYENLAGVKLDAEKIAEIARKGDETALDVYRRTGYLLGKAAAYSVNLLNLEKIVLGGGVSGAFDLIHPEMSATLQRFCFAAANRDLRIEKTALGYEAALFGACATGFSTVSKPGTAGVSPAFAKR